MFGHIHMVSIIENDEIDVFDPYRWNFRRYYHTFAQSAKTIEYTDCRGVWSPQTSVLDMTLNYLMMRLLWF